MNLELALTWAAVLFYVLAAAGAIVEAVFRKQFWDLVLGLVLLGLVVHATAIGLRWERLGHGPFVTQYEILSSNLWSLLVVFTVSCVCLKAIRPIAALILPLMFIMMGWVLLAHPGEGFLPPTYDTIWMYVHIFLGKIFMGATLVAVGLALVILLRRYDLADFKQLPNNPSLDELAYRFIALALIFDTLMLVAGAIWAQDAWGRYWDWDTLESWSFLTWLSLVLAIHTRLTWKTPPVFGALLILVIFVFAFFTFFGVPFVSESTHKGAV